MQNQLIAQIKQLSACIQSQFVHPCTRALHALYIALTMSILNCLKHKTPPERGIICSKYKSLCLQQSYTAVRCLRRWSNITLNWANNEWTLQHHGTSQKLWDNLCPSQLCASSRMHTTKLGIQVPHWFYPSITEFTPKKMGPPLLVGDFDAPIQEYVCTHVTALGRVVNARVVLDSAIGFMAHNCSLLANSTHILSVKS